MTTRLHPLYPGVALLLFSLASACTGSSSSSSSSSSSDARHDVGEAADAGDATDDAKLSDSRDTSEGTSSTPPTIISTLPVGDAAEVPVNSSVSAVFSEPMDATTLTGGSFTLTPAGAGAPVSGTVIYGRQAAVLWPTAHLELDTEYTATITVAASSAAGVALAQDHEWTFTTGAAVAPGLPVDLGEAGQFAILAKTGISTVPGSAITGDLGVSPAAATYITGFSLTADPSNVFATTPQVTGEVFASDYAPPTPARLTAAVSDMLLAFTDAAGRAPDVTELGAGEIGGKTLAPGVYKWGTGVLIPADVTLDGGATDVWILQIAQGLTMSSGAKVVLTGGALAKNIFWQVAGKVELRTGAHVEGVVLTQTSVTLETGASINGRLLAQTAVDLDASTVVEPAP